MSFEKISLPFEYMVVGRSKRRRLVDRLFVRENLSADIRVIERSDLEGSVEIGGVRDGLYSIHEGRLLRPVRTIRWKHLSLEDFNATMASYWPSANGLEFPYENAFGMPGLSGSPHVVDKRIVALEDLRDVEESQRERRLNEAKRTAENLVVLDGELYTTRFDAVYTMNADLGSCSVAWTEAVEPKIQPAITWCRRIEKGEEFGVTAVPGVMPVKVEGDLDLLRQDFPDIQHHLGSALARSADLLTSHMSTISLVGGTFHWNRSSDALDETLFDIRRCLRLLDRDLRADPDAHAEAGLAALERLREEILKIPKSQLDVASTDLVERTAFMIEPGQRWRSAERGWQPSPRIDASDWDAFAP